MKSIDVEDSIDGFVKAIGKNEMFPSFRIYQSLVSSYFFFKKLIKTYNPGFLLVTGNLPVLPKSMAEKTIVYVHFPTDLIISPLLQKDYTSKIWLDKASQLRQYAQRFSMENYNKNLKLFITS